MEAMMKDRPQRRSIRLQDYDYAQAGAYFVTVCTHERQCLFGQITEGEMNLSHYGLIVRACWDDLGQHYQDVELDAFVIMPNHVHGIIVFDKQESIGEAGGFQTHPYGESVRAERGHGLSEIVRGFKTFSSKQINVQRGMTGIPLWQRNYYEHIIRSEQALAAIREYIDRNPLNWAQDKEYSINDSA